MTGIDPIPAIPEASATGEIATLYADLRRSLGAPFVNLIWRHLATIPGGLAATWTLVRPLYLGPDLAREAARLADTVELPPGLGLPDFVWAAAGLEGARAEIAAILAEYNRANATNFLALLTARLALRSESFGATAGAASSSNRAPAQAAVPIRPLPGLSDLPPASLALVEALDGLGRLAPSPAIASLYRHLAYWPAFLALAYVALEPHHRSGLLQREQEELIADGHRTARLLGPQLSAAAPALGPEERERVLVALDEFTGLMIGRMVVMGGALLALLPEDTG